MVTKQQQEWLDMVLEAVPNKSVIITYLDAKGQLTEKREIFPWQVVVHPVTGNVLIHAMCILRGANRAFNLDGIQKLEVGHEVAECPAILKTTNGVKIVVPDTRKLPKAGPQTLPEHLVRRYLDTGNWMPEFKNVVLQ